MSGGAISTNATNNTSNNGPCGACKFLRRKCAKGCIFAPYFDSDQTGTAQFAAVHKVFGASNASKLLLQLPPHKRLDAVVTLCYEALARSRDPVYGCVGHIFTLQQQARKIKRFGRDCESLSSRSLPVINMQAELAYTQARLSILQRLPPSSLSPLPQQPQSLSPTSFHSSSELHSYTTTANSSMPNFDPFQSNSQMTSEMASICDSLVRELEDDGSDLQVLARDFVSRHLTGLRSGPPPASPH